MWLCGFLGAFASELEVHVQVPGAAPVWVTVPDVGPGAGHRVEFPGAKGAKYALAIDVQSHEGDVWQVGFDLAELASRGRGAGATSIAKPVMKAPTDTVALFSMGRTTPLVGADPQVFRFDGYQIDWIVRP